MGSKFIFLGSPRFAAIVLEKLLKAGLSPVAVVTNPDKPKGRKRIITPPPVKLLAEGKIIDVIQPATKEELLEQLGGYSPDFMIIAAYSKIVPQAVLDKAKLGTIGVHPSLLPKYRGASPIQEVIRAGERVSGVSLYLVDEKMDHGPILAQEKVDIEGMSYAEAEEKLAEKGGSMLVALIPDFIEGKAKLKEQDHETATITKKLKTEDGLVNIEDLKKAMSGLGAQTVHQKILAYNPEPGVFTINKEKRIKLLKSSVENGSLKLNAIQVEGRKPTNNFPQDLFS